MGFMEIGIAVFATVVIYKIITSIHASLFDMLIFQMAYEKNTGLYGKDFTVDWDTFKEVYNARNQLGGKK